MTNYPTVISLFICAFVLAPASFAQEPVQFSPGELQRILRLSPLPPIPDDPSNSVANDHAAALFGQYLFFDPNLSSSKRIACASCHIPNKNWADGLKTPPGGLRNTPSLLNVAYNRWFFWDGRADSLWSQALKPIESESEMNGDRTAVLHYIRSTEKLYVMYERLFGDLEFLQRDVPAHAKPATREPAAEMAVAWSSISEPLRDSINKAFANVGKAIAAFERRLVSSNAPFDRFVEGVRVGDDRQNAISEEAKRGLKLFLGKGDCTNCHFGPTFSNEEFHSLGLAPPTYASWSDSGRLMGIRTLLDDEFRLTGRYADRESQRGDYVTAFVRESPDLAGKFKTPSLRNVAVTAPYMHAGHFGSLNEVLSFYSDFKGADVADHHRESTLKPLRLTVNEIRQLIAFLESLTGQNLDRALMHDPQESE
jgi:cytochrome c peroxidase